MNRTLKFLESKISFHVDSKSPIEIYEINRTTMAKFLGVLGFKEGAEIGVAEGYHAKVLCEQNPGVRLHCIDVWEKYPGYEEYPNIDQIYSEVKVRLNPFNTPFYKEFSMKALRHFNDNSLDFVYIDGAHDFLNVSMDVCEWSKKVRPGGIVFGHDYKRARTGIVHVKDVIPAYMYAHGIKPWFVLTNDIKDPRFGNDNPGWMYVRQESDKL